MSELYPTPTRLALLRRCANSEVYRYRTLASMRKAADEIVSETVDHRTVTAACIELEQHRWIKPGLSEGPSMYARRPFILGDVGIEVLKAHPIPFVNAELPKELTDGFVAGLCGHRVAGSEWRAGMFNCERC